MGGNLRTGLLAMGETLCCSGLMGYGGSLNLVFHFQMVWYNLGGSFSATCLEKQGVWVSVEYIMAKLLLHLRNSTLTFTDHTNVQLLCTSALPLPNTTPVLY